MQQQELFFEEREGNRRVEVFKTYDRAFSREAFSAMDQAARNHLWNWLEIDQIHEPDEVPGRDTAAGEDFLWEELLDSARGREPAVFLCSQRDRGWALGSPVCLARLAQRGGFREKAHDERDLSGVSIHA